VEGDPTWSPDGNSLAFGHFDPFHPDQTFIEVFNFKTHSLSQLPGSQQIFAPRWSPDGRHIIAISYDGNKLMLYDVKSGKWRQLNIDVNSFGYLAWSHDSAYVYFDTVLLARGGYFRVRISDSKLEKVIDLTKFRQFPQQFGPGSWTGLGPGDIPLIPRDISTQEIYAFAASVKFRKIAKPAVSLRSMRNPQRLAPILRGDISCIEPAKARDQRSRDRGHRRPLAQIARLLSSAEETEYAQTKRYRAGQHTSNSHHSAACAVP
jgi:hypothetical protein